MVARSDGVPQYRKNTTQEMIWTAARILKVFTCHDLIQVTGKVRGIVSWLLMSKKLIKKAGVQEKCGVYQLIGSDKNGRI